MVFLDAPRVKVREEAVVRNKAVYLALGVQRDGTRDVLGIWIETTEGAKFWMKVFNDLRTRGVSDILIAVADGLKGMPEALGAVFPATTLQTCIVHLIRNSLDYASWKDRKALAAALRPSYAAPSAEAAEAALDAFAAGPWGQKFPTIVAAWRRARVNYDSNEDNPFVSEPALPSSAAFRVRASISGWRPRSTRSRWRRRGTGGGNSFGMGVDP